MSLSIVCGKITTLQIADQLAKTDQLTQINLDHKLHSNIVCQKNRKAIVGCERVIPVRKANSKKPGDCRRLESFTDPHN